MIGTDAQVDLALVSMIGTVLTGIVATVGAYLTQKAKADQEQHRQMLDEMHAEVSSVKSALDAHVAWEMAEKYKEQP